MKRFYEGSLKIEVLEPVDVFNGFEGRREGLYLSVREASVEEGEGAFNTHLPRPLLDAFKVSLGVSLGFASLMSALFTDLNNGFSHVYNLPIWCMVFYEYVE